MRQPPRAGAALTVKAIILAAGRGLRLGELTAAQPKCLTRLHGKPLIEWQLAALRRAGLTEIAVVRGYRGDTLQLDTTFFENARWDATNSVMSLVAADAWLRADPCLVSYSDIVYTSATLTALRAVAGDIAITYDPAWLALWRARFADPLSDAETFRIDPDGTLVEIGGRATRLADVQGQYMGLIKCTPRGWSRMRTLIDASPVEEQNRMDVTALLRRLLAQGERIATVACLGRWYEVDSASDLALYETMEPVA